MTAAACCCCCCFDMHALLLFCTCTRTRLAYGAKYFYARKAERDNRSTIIRLLSYQVLVTAALVVLTHLCCRSRIACEVGQAACSLSLGDTQRHSFDDNLGADQMLACLLGGSLGKSWRLGWKLWSSSLALFFLPFWPFACSVLHDPQKPAISNGQRCLPRKLSPRIKP